jgi:hypothetical protein
VSVGRVHRDACRRPGSDARSRAALGCGCVGLSLAPCVGLGFLIRLRFASRGLAMWRVCAIALSFVSGWRAFSSVSLCNSIIYRDLVRLRFALHSFAVWCVCTMAPSFISGWRAFFSVSLCKSIMYREIFCKSYNLQRETKEKARQPETKPGANAQTRHKARLRIAKRSRTKHPKPTYGARDRPKQPQPRAGRDRASGSGQRHASRRTRPTDTGTRCPGNGGNAYPKYPIAMRWPLFRKHLS